MMHARNKRLNAAERAVFDIYNDAGPIERFQATVEVNSSAPGMLKVLYGALTPTGKEKVWNAIRAYEGVRQ